MQGTLDGEERMLGSYPVEDYMRIHVVDTNPHRIKNQYTDVSLVEKFELTDDQYEKRTGNSIRSGQVKKKKKKKKHNLRVFFFFGAHL